MVCLIFGEILLYKHCNYDLHSHSHYSDGQFSPQSLLDHASQKQVKVLALTDHDTLAGIPEAAVAAKEHGIKLIHGVEISTRWNNKDIHIVGLNVDTQCENLQISLLRQRKIRDSRSKEIALALGRIGISDAYQKARKLARDDNIIRPHFAQVLLEAGVVRTLQEAFERYLKRGKVAYVPTKWPALDKVVNWIKGAGGVPVLAHPARYRLTSTKLRLLLRDFKETGGEAIEVVTATQTVQEQHKLASFCRDYDLAASVGSDFHGMDSYARLGGLVPLPDTCTPIWEKFDL